MSIDFFSQLFRSTSFFSVTRSRLLASAISVVLMGGVVSAQTTPPITSSGLQTQVNISTTAPPQK